MKPIALALLLAGFALPAGDPAGVYFWKSAELKGFSTSLPSKMNAQKLASQNLGSHGNFALSVSHREASGEAEYHALQADIFFVQTGEATLIVGGELENGKTTAPNEMRAPSAKGGTEKKLAAGDVVTIPAKVVHQLELDAGKEFTYFVVKVTQP
ncbi:MAG: cupin domain-containing protein [Candidatus Solibacter sp.]